MSFHAYFDTRLSYFSLYLSLLELVIEVISISLSYSIDVNECLDAAVDGFDLCDPSMLCVNNEGSYTCQCPGGTMAVDDGCIEPGMYGFYKVCLYMQC